MDSLHWQIKWYIVDKDNNIIESFRCKMLARRRLKYYKHYDYTIKHKYLVDKNE